VFTWSDNITNNQAFVPLDAQHSYVLTATSPILNTCIDKDTVTVTTIQKPNLPVLSDTIICAGQSIVYAASGANTYNWSNGIINGVPFTPSVTATYQLIAFNANVAGCSDTLNVTATVAPMPIAIAPNDTTICYGQSLVLAGAGQGTFTWNDNVTNNQAFIPVDAQHSYVLTAASPVLNTCIDKDTVTVTTVLKPSITATADTAICAGQSIQLLASGAPTIVWSNGIINGNVYTPSTSDTLFAYGFNSSVFGCADTAKVVVQVASLPIAIAPNDTIICAGSAMVLNAAGIGNFTWSNGVINGVPFAPADSVNKYVLTATSANLSSCKSTDTVTVITKVKPNVWTINDTTICAGQSIILNAGGATNMAWSNGMNIGASYTPMTTDTILFIGNNSSVYGCADTQKVIITVAPMPIAIAPNDTTICGGSSLVLNASGQGVFVWSDNVINNQAFVPADPTHQYILTATSPVLASCVAKDSVTVTTIPIPTLSLNADTVICAGQSILLQASGATNLVWSNGLTNGSAYTPLATDTLTIYASNGNLVSCADTASFIITVAQMPIAIAPNDTTLCQGQPLAFVANGQGDLVWSDNITNGQVVTITDSFHQYTLTATSPVLNTCVVSDVFKVSTIAKPSITSSTDTTICKGETIYLTASGATNISWSNGLSNNSYYAPIVTDTLYAIGLNSALFGCADTNKLVVTVVNTPNAYAPNDTTICSGESLQLNIAGPYNTVWNNGIINNQVFTPTASSITYVVTVSSPILARCATVDSTTVTVLTRPVIYTSADTAICKNNEVMLYAYGAPNIVWSNSIPNGSSILFDQTDTVFAIAYAGNLQSCADTVSKIITAFDKPTVSLTTQDTTICLGYSLMLSASGCISYTWSGGIINNTPFTPTDTTVYQVIGSMAPGCSDTALAIVNVNELTLCAPFAINILKFNGVANSDKSNSLYWKVMEQSKVQEYQLQKRMKDNSYQTITTVYPDVNLHGEYHFMDANPADLEYYKLKVVELNGSITYSDVVVLTHQSALVNSFVFPNPATDKINAVITSTVNNSELDIQILDISGKVVLEKREMIDIGTYTFTFDISALSTGNYMIRYVNEGDNANGVVRFTKAKK
jgi:Secretion system C-terminal sorting domain